ncbi:hypothetical protein BLAHAN_04524 [Blautia hansenii DSM 20583]|uniref:Uncharacterized protein n=1 Tax=Blautia hansenii DSM 20583 TaxID=537007 RepID=C9L574_BLAHA|nr:hypothetical protein BLAHAN_04524 [Blautia hansenii DSM 20583]
MTDINIIYLLQNNTHLITDGLMWSTTGKSECEKSRPSGQHLLIYKCCPFFISCGEWEKGE